MNEGDGKSGDSSDNDDDDYYMRSESKDESSQKVVLGLRKLSIDLKEIHAEQQAPTGIQERDILCIFELPDGSEGDGTFKLGHTVEYLKSYIECEYGIPMLEQVL
jgi:hypothetical protein